MRNIFRASTLVELIHQVFGYEGWPLVEGENRSARLTKSFDVTPDAERNVFVATRKGYVRPNRKAKGNRK